MGLLTFNSALFAPRGILLAMAIAPALIYALHELTDEESKKCRLFEITVART